MSSFIHSDFFSFVTTTALLIGEILLIVVIVYVISIMKILHDIVSVLQKKVHGFSSKVDGIEKYIKDLSVVQWITSFLMKYKKLKKSKS